MTVLKRILAATDFSPGARCALSRAGQLARQHDAYLHVVHAQPDWELFAGSAGARAEHYRAITEYAQHALREEVEHVYATFGVRARGETRTGRASQVLLSVAGEIEPHLIVAGARGEHDTPDQAPFLGGTALKLITHSGSPVLIVRKPVTGAYAIAVAAVESSGTGARELVLWAISLLDDGDCHVVHAFDLPYVVRMRKRRIPEAAILSCTEDLRQAAKSFIDTLLDEETASGQRLHAHLVCGEPVSAVLAEIERCRPDVVVVGKHERTPRESRVGSLGSVALRIAYHVSNDILVVP